MQPSAFLIALILLPQLCMAYNFEDQGGPTHGPLLYRGDVFDTLEVAEISITFEYAWGTNVVTLKVIIMYCGDTYEGDNGEVRIFITKDMFWSELCKVRGQSAVKMSMTS